jgi:hypothetical protein
MKYPLLDLDTPLRVVDAHLGSGLLLQLHSSQLVVSASVLPYQLVVTASVLLFLLPPAPALTISPPLLHSPSLLHRRP